MSKKVAFVSIAMLVVVGATWAQVPGSTVPTEPDRLGIVPPDAMSPVGTNTYGIQNFTAAVTAPHAFQPFNTGLGYISWVGGYIGPQLGDTFRGFDAPVYLPTGALIDSVKALVYDDDAAGFVSILLLLDECLAGSECTITTLVDEATGDAETPGYTILSSSAVVEDMTWKNFDASAVTVNPGRFRVAFSAASHSLRVGPVWIWYQRQISPAPAVATFPDVAPGFWAFQEIEALPPWGIPTGFPDGPFRPLEPVTRAQMATFLARALGLDYSDFAY